MSRCGSVPWGSLAFGVLIIASPATANNGLTLIGAGAESVAMGGADVAVARDTTALSTNPAGLSQLRGWAHDGYLAAAYALGVRHADRFGNDRDVSNSLVPVTGAGLSHRIDGTGLTVGIGMFATAGAGNVYDDLETPYGGRDTLRALFGVFKVVPGVAWQATERLALGFALNVHYSSLKQRFFPNVSQFDPQVPAQAFFGSEIRNASTVQVGVKAGALYKPSPAWALGLTYSPRLDLPFDNGRFIANYAALGLGNVTYRKLELTGLALPAEVAAGIAFQPTPQWLVALDLSRSNYSRALRSQRLVAWDPDDQRAPPTVTIEADLDWRDQTVVAAGVAYAADESTKVYAGINYGRNPIPARTLNPLLATIGEWHVTAGYSRRLNELWTMIAAVEYLFPKEVRYDNPQLPFGPDARERVSYVGVNVMFSRRW